MFEFNTLTKCYKWKIYAAFITNADPDEDNGYVFNYIYPYMDGENFNGFIEEVNKRRLYVTDVDITDEHVLAPYIAAGTKDTDNSFTGVMLGAAAGYWGMYGYQSGV